MYRKRRKMIMAKKANAETEVRPERPEIVNSVETLKLRIAEVRAAQEKFATYTQEQVDAIFLAAAMAANTEARP